MIDMKMKTLLDYLGTHWFGDMINVLSQGGDARAWFRGCGYASMEIHAQCGAVYVYLHFL